jgi:hypothetical protein
LAHLSIDVVVPAGSSVTLTAADALILWLAYQEAKALIGFDAPPNSPESPQAKCHSQQPTERLSQKQARVRLPPGTEGGSRTRAGGRYHQL